jgi:HEAT repeat protein
MTSIEFSVVGILLGLYGLLVFAFFLAAVGRGFIWRRRARMSAALLPEIREALVDHLAGSNDLERILGLMRKSRSNVSDVILGFQGTVGGNALNRLCQLALKLGLVQDWVQDARSRDRVRRRIAFERLAFVAAYEPCRRVTGDLLAESIEDPDPEVWLWASRAVIQFGSGERIEEVFQLAVSQSLLIRILLTEALRRHAAGLCKNAVPSVLRSNDAKRVLATLDILVAWERAIDIPNMHELLQHRVKDVRIQAFRLAPLVPLIPENRAAIINGLSDTDPDISTAAALSAGRLQIAEAVPALARMLRVSPGDLARTAADALAEMPPRGWQALEEFSASANPVTASAATAALERARRKAIP